MCCQSVSSQVACGNRAVISGSAVMFGVPAHNTKIAAAKISRFIHPSRNFPKAFGASLPNSLPSLSPLILIQIRLGPEMHPPGTLDEIPLLRFLDCVRSRRDLLQVVRRRGVTMLLPTPYPPPHTFCMNIKTKQLGRFIVG